MRIKNLEIYGFGRLEERKYNLDRPFTQIYGENETGKSTMQRFIHAILFGFPKAHEVQLLPRFADKYGGNMTFELDDEIIFVERVWQNNKEHVTVKRGEVKKDEEWLKQALNFITKDTYQQLFSFDVLGLQQVHHLTETHLQDYLLQAGVFGSSAFSALETKLKLQKNELFSEDKSHGVLSEHLTELQNLELQMQEEKERMSEYDEIDRRHYQLTGRLETMKEHLSQLEELQAAKQKELMYQPDMKEWKQLELKLNVPEVTFPDHGIERYEALKHQIQNLTRDIAIRQEKIAQLEQEATGVTKMDEGLFRLMGELVEEEAVVKEADKQRKALKKELKEKNEKQQALMSDIGWAEFHPVDINTHMKEQIVKAMADKERITNEKNHLQRDFDLTAEEFQRSETELDETIQNIVSDEQYDKGIELKEQQSDLHKKTELYHKLNTEQERLAADELMKQRQLNMIYGTTLIISLALSIYCFVIGQMLTGALLLLVPIVMAILMVMNKPVINAHQNIMKQELSTLEESIAHLAASFESFDINDQAKLRETRNALTLQRNRENRKLKRLETQLKVTQEQLESTTHTLQRLKKQLHLSDGFEDNLLHHAYKTVKHIQELQPEIDELQRTLADKKQQIAAFNVKTEQLELPAASEGVSVIFHALNKKMSDENKSRKTLARVNEQWQLATNEAASLNTSLLEMQHEVQQLMDEAQSENESAYYKRYQTHLEYNADMKRFTEISFKLDEENFSYEQKSAIAYTSLSDLRGQEEELTRQLNDMRADYHQQLHEQQTLEQELNEYESSTELSDLTYRYEIEKNIIRTLAREYSALEYVDLLINAHRLTVKEERIPYIISIASEIFKDLTEGRYKKVMYQDALLVKHKDGQVYHPTELSQSTKELLYIAMRLSLIQHLTHIYPFPIIIDDAFVHFDKHRKDHIIEYLFNHAKHQILYFTCNKSLNITGKNTLTLERHDKENRT